MDAYDTADLRLAATAGIRAPSLHNSQPWLFRLNNGAIDVLTDPRRALPRADPTGWAARIACGAAVLNARLALAANGTPTETTLLPDPREPTLVARLRPDRRRPPTPAERRLYAAVPRRHSNRQPFADTPVPADVRGRLVRAAADEGAWLELLIGMTALSAVVEIVASADRVLRRDDGYQSELTDWTRVLDSADGVPVAAAAPVTESQDLLPQRPYGGRQRAAGRDYEPQPLVAVLGGPGDLPADQVNAGQALQRVLLTVTAAGLTSSMISQPIEVPAAREQLRIALRRHGAPHMMLRVGYGQPGRPTPRRAVDDVILG